MARFAFRIDECLPDVDGFDGIFLAGPPLEKGFDFQVGQRIVVPTAAGEVVARCTAFVFPRWGPGREDWLTITVVGVDFASVPKGQVAHAESGGPEVLER